MYHYLYKGSAKSFDQWPIKTRQMQISQSFFLFISFKKVSFVRYSQISVIRTSIIRNYWVIRRRRTVPTFFSISYCNNTTYYSNFDYPKNSIFRSDSSVPIKKIAIKLPFKVQSSNGPTLCASWNGDLMTGR